MVQLLLLLLYVHSSFIHSLHSPWKSTLPPSVIHLPRVIQLFAQSWRHSWLFQPRIHRSRRLPSETFRRGVKSTMLTATTTFSHHDCRLHGSFVHSVVLYALSFGVCVLFCSSLPHSPFSSAFLRDLALIPFHTSWLAHNANRFGLRALSTLLFVAGRQVS